MSFSAQDANKVWKLTKEQEDRINACTSGTEICELTRQFGLENGVIQHLDGAAPDCLVDVPQAEPVASEIKTMKIDGKIVEGDQATIDAAMRAAFSKTVQPQDDQPARGADGRFAKTSTQKTAEDSALAAAERAELDLQFKRGQIDSATFLERSGALKEALEKQLGVPFEQIAGAFQKHAGDIETQSWVEATHSFLKSKDGAAWPGGSANQKKIQEIMTTQKTTDGVLLAEYPDKVAAIRMAADYMRENDLIVENSDIKQEREATLKAQIEAAKSPQEIAEILGVNDRRVARETAVRTPPRSSMV